MTKKINICPDNNWTIPMLETMYEHVSRIGKEHLCLDWYPNQFEIITSEQLLDNSSLVGLPLSYNHWRYGKQFIIDQNKYLKGFSNLSYELIINSNSCISYNLETNTSCLMLMVMAHAAIGHNFFFKNNYLFKEFTNADAIIDYMNFAKNYINWAEERYGWQEVERFLDYAHAIEEYGISLYHKIKKLSVKEEEKRMKERALEDEKFLTPFTKTKKQNKNFNSFEPEENLLYFIEKNSTILTNWQKEILRIVRKVSTYFYPQRLTKVINEGCATFVHYEIMNKLFDEGHLDEKCMFEFIKHHTSVINQPPFDSKYYSGLNPYNLGFKIFSDVKRMCLEPTKEDENYFPEIVGKNWKTQFKYICENYKDSSFLLQYLSPKIIRDLKLFLLENDSDKDYYLVEKIHNESGYRRIREALSEEHSEINYKPNIKITDVDENGVLTISYRPYKERGIKNEDDNIIIDFIEELWGKDVDFIYT